MTADDLKRFDLCPKWGKCSAPICPLDADWHKRIQLGSEPVCYYLSEYVKPDAQGTFEQSGKRELFEAISTVAQPMIARWPRIRLALERAKETGSRLATLAPWQKGSRPDV